MARELKTEGGTDMVSEAKARELIPKGDFKVVRKGYDPSDVDTYVAKLRRSATDQLARVANLEEALKEAHDASAKAKDAVREEITAKMAKQLENAELKAKELVEGAEKEAKPLQGANEAARHKLLEAEKTAHKVLERAETEAKQIVVEAGKLREGAASRYQELTALATSKMEVAEAQAAKLTDAE